MVVVVFNLVFFYGCETKTEKEEEKKEQNAAAPKKEKTLPTYEYADNNQTLLWEISGNGLAQKSFLYGTIHIQMKEVFQYDDVVQQVFDYCDAYAMEVLMDEIDLMEVSSAMMMKDTTLQDLMTEEEYVRLEAEFKEKTGMALGLMSTTKPFFVSAQMALMSLPKDMPDALDLHLLKMARADSTKKALGIEEFMTQVNAIDQMSLKDQAKMMVESLDSNSAMSLDKLDEMLAAYLASDLDALIELTNDTTLPPQFQKALLQDRNYGMADKIEGFAKKQSTFNAIGAGHLGGEEGVIELLRKKGFEVKPIKTEFDKTKEVGAKSEE